MGRIDVDEGDQCGSDQGRRDVSNVCMCVCLRCGSPSDGDGEYLCLLVSPTRDRQQRLAQDNRKDSSLRHSASVTAVYVYFAQIVSDVVASGSNVTQIVDFRNSGEAREGHDCWTKLMHAFCTSSAEVAL